MSTRRGADAESKVDETERPQKGILYGSGVIHFSHPSALDSQPKNQVQGSTRFVIPFVCLQRKELDKV